MNLEDFKKEFQNQSKYINHELNDEKIEKIYNYMNKMIEWNEKINLTAITEPTEMIEKHFIDSLTALKYIKDDFSVIDVGTGAGLPGIPLAICSNAKFTLLDSLNKRINFLKEVKEDIGLNNVELEHGRAEDFAKVKENRESFDIAISRAVAPMNVLVEYLLPFVKVGGKVICMKGPKGVEELNQINKGIEILGGKIEKIEEIKIGKEDLERKIIIINKIKNTPSKYPRKAGMPAKEPLK